MKSCISTLTFPWNQTIMWNNRGFITSQLTLFTHIILVATVLTVTVLCAPILHRPSSMPNNETAAQLNQNTRTSWLNWKLSQSSTTSPQQASVCKALILNNNNNVHLSCTDQRPESSHDTYQIRITLGKLPSLESSTSLSKLTLSS